MAKSKKSGRSVSLETLAARMTATLARPARSKSGKALLKDLGKRDKIVVSATDYPPSAAQVAAVAATALAKRDAERYADWEARGKPAFPSVPRRDRMRPSRRAPSTTPPMRERLLFAQEGLCGGCGLELDLYDATIDHVVPKALGGPNCMSNYLVMHGDCNNQKADRLPTIEERAANERKNVALGIILATR